MDNKKFRRDGYVLWLASSPRPYLASGTEWTNDIDRAYIFSEIDDAIASCKHWAYFAATTNIEVVEVKAGKYLFEDGDTVYRED